MNTPAMSGSRSRRSPTLVETAVTLLSAYHAKM